MSYCHNYCFFSSVLICSRVFKGIWVIPGLGKTTSPWDGDRVKTRRPPLLEQGTASEKRRCRAGASEQTWVELSLLLAEGTSSFQKLRFCLPNSSWNYQLLSWSFVTHPTQPFITIHLNLCDAFFFFLQALGKPKEEGRERESERKLYSLCFLLSAFYDALTSWGLTDLGKMAPCRVA